MILLTGTRIKVTEIKEKDYCWTEGEFEKASKELNGKTGVILETYKSKDKESNCYLVLIETEAGSQGYELEENEFEILD